MYIDINLTREGKIQLSISNSRHHMPPNWAVDWVRKNSDSEFNRITNTTTCIDDKNLILPFLDTWISEGNNRQISQKRDDESIYLHSSMNLSSITQVNAVYSKLKELIQKDKVTPEEFESLKSARLQSMKQAMGEIKNSNKTCKQQFLDMHKQLLDDAKGGLFGGWRRSKMDSTLDLPGLLQYAKHNNNRSREAFVKLGWMDKQGNLNDKTAPQEVKDAYPKEKTWGKDR